MSHFWVMCFFLMKLTSQIREMWIGIICIIGQMRISLPFQHPWSVNGWCHIVGDHVIGPHFFEGRLTWQDYANFLQNVLSQLMYVPKLHHKCWLKLDGLFISEWTSAYKLRVIASSIFCRFYTQTKVWVYLQKMLVGPLKVIIPICFNFSTIFILLVTRITLCCRSLNSS